MTRGLPEGDERRVLGEMDGARKGSSETALKSERGEGEGEGEGEANWSNDSTANRAFPSETRDLKRVAMRVHVAGRDAERSSPALTIITLMI